MKLYNNIVAFVGLLMCFSAQNMALAAEPAAGGNKLIIPATNGSSTQSQIDSKNAALTLPGGIPRSTSEPIAGDFDNSGIVTSQEVYKVVDLFLGNPPVPGDNFDIADRNHDGKVSIGEVIQSVNSFLLSNPAGASAAMDTNKDGRISDDEKSRWISHTMNPPIPGDFNRDGKVTRDEVMRSVDLFLGQVPISQEEFDIADRNHDGKVSIGEVVQCVNSFLQSNPRGALTAMDTNKDGKISDDEKNKWMSHVTGHKTA